MTWRKYILWFAQEHVEFRKAEIESILKLKNICMKHVINLQENEPFLLVELPDEESARSIASRSVTLRCILEYWTHSTNFQQFHGDVASYINANFNQLSHYFEKSNSFKITVETYNKHFTQAEKVAKIDEFDYLPVKGGVNLKNPNTNWWYIEYYGTNPLEVPTDPIYTFFGRWIVDGQRSLINELSLKRRKFIGNTSMDPQLSLLMANQALVKRGDLIFDPFVGTGSLLIAAAKFGGCVMGTDIDFLMLHGRTKPSRISQKVREDDECVEANFEQYKCASQYIDVLVSDFSLEVWGEHFKLDSIITDPPYGIREATEKIETKSKRKNAAEPKEDVPHFPSTSSYNLDELFNDLLVFAAKHLKLNGRLVCWIPVYRDDYAEEKLPSHGCLNVISNSEQVLSGFSSRRLLTYEKFKEYDPAEDYDDNGKRKEMDFRAKYFYHGEETRKERRTRRAELREIGRQEALKRGKILNEEGKVVNPNKVNKL